MTPINALKRLDKVCACCGSRFMGDVSTSKRYDVVGGISIWTGEARPFESVVTKRETIQTKNGPLTIAVRKA